MDCVFCDIANKKTEADIIYEDKDIVAFNDIIPKAPHHILIIPRKHIETLNDITEEDTLLIGHLHQIAKQLAQQLGFAEKGYRTLINCNREGGQAVFHLHLHLLGGRTLHWPPG